jgi:hypothetical protein
MLCSGVYRDTDDTPGDGSGEWCHRKLLLPGYPVRSFELVRDFSSSFSRSAVIAVRPTADQMW